MSLPFLTSCLQKTPPLRVSTFQTLRALALLAGIEQITAKLMRQPCSQMCHHAWKISMVSKLCCTSRLTSTIFILFYFTFKERLIWRSVNSYKNRFNEAFRVSGWDIELWVASSRCWTREWLVNLDNAKQA